jgi:hypothetical protein
MMVFTPSRRPADPRTLDVRAGRTQKQERAREIVAEIQEKERRNRELALEMVETLLPDYEDVPLGAR